MGIYDVRRDNTNIIVPNNSNSDDRWEVVDQREEFTKSQHRASDKTLRRTNVVYGYDRLLDRPVIFRGPKYDLEAGKSDDEIIQKRKIIREQIDLLNSISSNMLPEPIEYLEVTDESLDIYGKDIKDTEPILVLDYIPGADLSWMINSRKNNFFYSMNDGESIEEDKSKIEKKINVSMIMRLALDILSFLENLYKKGFAYTSLSTDHIILLMDNKPRFIGIGRICKIENDRYDNKHSNYGRQLLGYSPPEMNVQSNRFGLNSSVKSVVAFNLGVIISRIIKQRSTFKEVELKDGAYDYYGDQGLRKIVKGSINGEDLDSLLVKLLALNPANRMNDFDEIKRSFQIISGDIDRNDLRGTPIKGSINFIDYNKGFGFASDYDGNDYYINVNYSDNCPRFAEYGDEVLFYAKPGERGKPIVDRFLNVSKFPEKPTISKQASPRVVPKKIPVPTPEATPAPTPEPNRVNSLRQHGSIAGLIIVFIFIVIMLYLWAWSRYIVVTKDEVEATSEETAVEEVEKEHTKVEESEIIDQYIKIIVTDGNVREGPGIDNGVIKIVHENEMYVYTGHSETPEARTWYEIYMDEDKNETGWVSSIVGELQE